LASSKRDTDSPRGSTSQSGASLRRGGPTDSPRGSAPQSGVSLRRDTTPHLNRRRPADPVQDPGEWSGANEGDTFAEIHLPAGEDDFDEDTFTDRDSDTSEIASRDTLRELVGRDTLLDLTATALALSGETTFDDTDAFSADRTLDDDSFPDEDTFDEPTSEKSGR
jgi:hypothetical protein